MKMTRIGIRDIRFTEGGRPNGDGLIHASIYIGADYCISAEVNRDPRYRDRLDTEARRRLIEMLLGAIYGDVWDLATYAQILIKNSAAAHFHTDSAVFEILEILGRIGKSDDGIEQALEPYRNPEGKPKK